MHMARVNQEKTPKRNYSEDDMTKKSAVDGILPKTQTAVMNILNFRIFLLMNLTFWYYASQHTVKPLLSPQGLIYFKHVWAVGEGGILIETGGLFERGDLFNLAKTMVSVVPRLEHKMEKLKYKKLKVVQLRIKNNANSWWINQPGYVLMKFYSRDWLK